MFADPSATEPLAKLRSRRNTPTASMIALIVCFVTLTGSCGANKPTTVETMVSAPALPTSSNIAGANGATTLETVVSVDSEDEINNDNDRACGDADGVVPTAVDDTAAGAERADLARVPDVVGLSMEEAFSRLEAEGFAFYPAMRKVSEQGIEDRSVVAVFPVVGTLRPVCSLVVVEVQDSSLGNSTGSESPDSSGITAEDRDRARIELQIGVEFGDRRGQSHWDEETATFHIQIVDLSAEDIARLQDRYADETFTVRFSSGTIGIGHLEALNQRTKDLVDRIFDECERSSYGVGIDLESWSVFVLTSSEVAGTDSTKDCDNDMKRSVLSMAADFAKEHSIPADPSSLVLFREGTSTLAVFYE